MIEYHGRKMRIRTWARLWKVSPNTVSSRWGRGIRDKWQLVGFTEPQPFPLTKEQREWLAETRYARSGQKQRRGRLGRLDSEWEIACDLIGMPRVFAEDLRDELCT